MENYRRLIVASYDDAAADLEFMAEFGETMRDWDGTVADGLEPETVFGCSEFRLITPCN